MCSDWIFYLLRCNVRLAPTFAWRRGTVSSRNAKVQMGTNITSIRLARLARLALVATHVARTFTLFARERHRFCSPCWKERAPSNKKNDYLYNLRKWRRSKGPSVGVGEEIWRTRYAGRSSQTHGARNLGVLLWRDAYGLHSSKLIAGAPGGERLGFQTRVK